MIKDIDWEDLFLDGNVDDLWSRFADILLNLSRKHIPESKSKPKDFNTPWMDVNTLKSVRRKNTLWKKYKYCKNPESWGKYIEARNESANLVKKAKFIYEKNIASKAKDDTKIFWRFVQSKTKVKVNLQCLLDNNGVIVTNDREKAELLNSFFCSVFNKEEEQSMPEFEDRTDKKLEDIEFLEQDILPLLEKIKETKSPGSDKIHPKIIKETAKQLTKPLRLLFQESRTVATVPKAWKIAHVTPLYKKDSKLNPSNYRPISLTSIIGKVMETIIRNNLMKHMETNNLFSKEQHGFRKGGSCVTQLHEVLEDWTDKLDKKQEIDVIYFDFEKAFDRVPHKRLVIKLKGYGVQGNLLRWIENILSNRVQKVLVNGEESNPAPVTSGIPQGSVLGPILFSIYINDLPDVVGNTVKLFADDTKLYSVVDSVERKEDLQMDINNLSKWSKEWLLSFSKNKCKHMHFGTSFHSAYSSENEIIRTETKEKDLGIIIDNELKIQEHINTQVKRANRMLGVVKRSFTFLDNEMFLTLYKSLIRPYLEYGSNVWSVMYRKEDVTIDNVQRRATKLVRSVSGFDYPTRLRKLGLPTLQYRRIRQDLIETYKILNNYNSVNFEQFFELNESSTRGHEKKLFKKHHNLKIRRNFFSQRIVDIWNNLPEEVITARSVNSFKGLLNNHWKNCYFKFCPTYMNLEADKYRTPYENRLERRCLR